MTESVDTDQTAPIGAVCSGSTLFASKLNRQLFAAYIFRCIFFLVALRVNKVIAVFVISHLTQCLPGNYAYFFDVC